MAKLLSFNKRKTLFKAFVESEFIYCPIVCMFHSGRSNNKINRLHKRALTIVYDDNVSTFDQLLAMDKSFCIPLREKCPNTEFFLVRIFPHSD